MITPTHEFEAAEMAAKTPLGTTGDGEENEKLKAVWTLDRPLRVLFVDDEPMLLALGRKFMEKLGFETVATTDPLDALEILKKGAFDLAVTDLTMPGMNGIDLCRCGRAVCPHSRWLLTTGFHNSLEGKSAEVLGFAAFLLKPYTYGQLREAVAKALSGHRLHMS